MHAIQIARDAIKTLWTNKALWLFGCFIIAGGGGGGAGGRAGTFSTGNDPWPGWAWPVLAVGGVVLVGILLMHVVSEGALIEGVRRSRAGEALRVREGFRAGLAHFGVLLRIKLLLVAAMVGAIGVIAAPAALYALNLAPVFTAVLSIPLAMIGIPAMLTVYLISVYALRIAVLEGKGAFESYRDARTFLAGRVLSSLQLLVVTVLGQVGGGVLGVIVMLPVALIGLALYFVVGMMPAAIVGGVLALPLALALAGALGTFRSMVWTLGFLEGRHEELA